MKRILQSSLAGLALSMALLARGGTYQDGDVLLIYHVYGSTSYNDVEFDIGSVNQFLNQTNGYTVAVNGWSLSTLTGVFGSDLSGVNVLLTSTQGRTSAGHLAWLSSATPTNYVNDVPVSQWQTLWSTINSIGYRPLIYPTATTPPSTPGSYSIDAASTGVSAVDAYDVIISGNNAAGLGHNNTSVAYFGGNVSFPVEAQLNDGTTAALGFWQIEGTNAYPSAQPAATYVGTFYADAAGDLTFVAGPVQPTVLGNSYSGGISDVTFTTQPGVNYSLVSTSALGTPITTWPVVNGPVQASGTTLTLSYTNSAETGFFGALSP